MRSKPIAVMLVAAFLAWTAALVFAIAGQNDISIRFCLFALILSVVAVTMDLMRG